MEEENKDLDYWLQKAKESRDDIEIGKLADILVEGFIWLMEHETSMQPTEESENTPVPPENHQPSLWD